MKWLAVLVPVLVLFSGCVDESSVDYSWGFNAGKSSRNTEVDGLENEIRVLEKSNRVLEKELERKTRVTREALENESRFLGLLKENSEELGELVRVVEALDGNVSQRISDLNEGIWDLNVSLADLNVLDCNGS